MSDIIEEKLNEEFCNMEIKVEKPHTQKLYMVNVIIDWNKGFKFAYPWQENLTVDPNVEEIKKLINQLLLSYFKKVR